MTEHPIGLWEAPDHTLAKLEILRRYLNAWFSILCRVPSVRELIYIDACCGPGEYSNGELGSPLVALCAAREAKGCAGRPIAFYFIDSEKSAIKHLRGLLAAETSPPYFRINAPIHGETADVLPIILRNLKALEAEGSGTVPLFVFIDGFGNVVPMQHIANILSKQSSEVFVLYNPSDVFRNVSNESERQRIVACFGTEHVLKLNVDEHLPYYIRQLKQHARFVRGFEMQNTRRRSIYHLFFATNNHTGFYKMKEAMWKVDQSGGFTFSDALDKNRTPLFDPKQVAQSALQHELCTEFAGKTVSGKVVKEYVAYSTNYLDEHKRLVLNAMLDHGLLQVPIKASGLKVRKRTYPEDCKIVFPNHFCGCEQCRQPR